MKIFSFRRRSVAAAAVVILILFILRPGASRLKSRIASSIAGALSRPVEIGSVHIRLLPQPGFDLENLVVYDAPAFGSEPLLRAPEVTAVLRLKSLLRGRIEIARLDLTEPSLNLVHSDGGRWNVEALLERSAHLPLAPTAKGKFEPRPAFPYIQASSARINFKFGQEKKPYALTNSDFSLWQDSENSWGIRLKAQPFRSDLNLSDTGLLRVNGTWSRAESLRDTPLQFSLQWDRPQLGQLTKFLTGNDKGWRGAVLLNAALEGTPGTLRITSDASIRDFRRYDILTGQALNLAAHCQSQFSSVDHILRQLDCQAPVGVGEINLTGDVGLPGSHYYDLSLIVENVPASAVAVLAQHAKKNLPDDLAATGTLNAKISLQRNPESTGEWQIQGRGEFAGLRVVSASNKAEVADTSVPFQFSSGPPGKVRHLRPLPDGPRLDFGPVSLARSGTGAASGWLNGAGYFISFSGGTEITRILRAAHLVGIPALTTAAEGAASLDVQIAGNWTDWSANNLSSYMQPLLTGTAKLRNVRVPIRGTSGPIEISSADLQFSHDGIRVSHLSVNAAGANWTGSLELPRGCGTPSACLIRFNLSTNETGLGDLRQWAHPDEDKRPWYSVLTTATKSPPSFLAGLHATGKLTANRLLVQRVWATRVSANVALDGGKVKFSDLRGAVLGGTHRGDFQADFAHDPPTFEGSGTFSAVSMAEVADVMRDPWIDGAAGCKYQLTAKGWSAQDFWQSADATAQFSINDGVLPHLSLANDSDALKIVSFAGQAHLVEKRIELKDAILESSAGLFQVNGTASLTRELNVELTRNAEAGSVPVSSPRYVISGSLSDPQVTEGAPAETQAQLKP